MAVFVLAPFVDVVRRSFLDAMGERFAGLDNYRLVLENQAFRLAAGNTVKFLFVCIPLLLAVSLGCALLVNGAGRMGKFFKTTFLLPMAVPVASIVLLWKLFLDDDGYLNQTLAFFHLPAASWLGSPAAFGVLIFTYLWKNVGYDMLLWLAGLAAIPDEQYEAARVDGAGTFACFRYVTLPGLRPSLLVTSILSLVNAFKVFREAYLIAGDYPHESIYMLQHLFNNWFANLDMQKMSAAAVLVAIAVTAAIAFILRAQKGGEDR